MFEAIHGSAPRRAGQNLANPSGLFLGAIQMLIHIGQPDVAERAHNARLRTIEEGIHTYDIYDPASSKERWGPELAAAVVARTRTTTGSPEGGAIRECTPASADPPSPYARPRSRSPLVGADVFIEFLGRPRNWLRVCNRCVPTVSNWRCCPIGDEGVARRAGGDVHRRRIPLPVSIAGLNPGPLKHRCVTSLLDRDHGRRTRVRETRGPLHFRRKARIQPRPGPIAEWAFPESWTGQAWSRYSRSESAPRDGGEVGAGMQFAPKSWRPPQPPRFQALDPRSPGRLPPKHRGLTDAATPCDLQPGSNRGREASPSRRRCSSFVKSRRGFGFRVT